MHGISNILKSFQFKRNQVMKYLILNLQVLLDSIYQAMYANNVELSFLSPHRLLFRSQTFPYFFQSLYFSNDFAV
jgi:hypothetical protein